MLIQLKTREFINPKMVCQVYTWNAPGAEKTEFCVYLALQGVHPLKWVFKTQEEANLCLANLIHVINDNGGD